MASSSSSQQQNEELTAFSGFEPAGIRRKVSESSRVYDVFINHRGPDVKTSLATQLYNSLKQLGIGVFLDSEEKVLGCSFPSIIEAAIRSAKLHIAIFSKTYAESPWCLAELVLMLQTPAKIIPLFYQVKPSDLRHIEKGAYAEAFITHKEKGRCHEEELKAWKEALRSASYIAGDEFSSFSDSHCQNIVEAVQKEVQRKTPLYVAEYPVGLDKLVTDFERRSLDGLVKDIEKECGLMKWKGKDKIVGIFGMGGVGKTTLAKELSNRKKSNYIKTSFLFNVREADATSQLPCLQHQLLKDLFDKDQDLTYTSTEEGTSYLNDHLNRSPLMNFLNIETSYPNDHLSRSSLMNFLIVVDDIDHVKQLNVLSIMDIVKKSGNCLVIITTRDEGVLISAGITDRYSLKGMDRNDGRELFCWHAFNQSSPLSGYEELVDAFVVFCAGLPLSLQVLGRHVRGRSKGYWSSELIKVSKMLHRDIKQRLRISFDSLDDEEKQVFMDVACFFLGKPIDLAKRILEGSGWNAQNAIETLKDKCLIDNKEDSSEGNILGMHDHLRDLGREMALELNPPYRLWRPQDLEPLESMDFKTILTKTNIRSFHSIFDESMGSKVTFFVGQQDTFFKTSCSLLWLQLEGNSTEQPSVPSWIPLQNLQFFKIIGGRLKTLWTNRIQGPSQLKELQIYQTSLKDFPDYVENEGKSLSVKAPMSGLEKLDISVEEFVSKILISGIHYPRLKSLKLHSMKNLMEVILTRVETLNCLDITNCNKIKRLKGIGDLTNLVVLNISQCPDLEFEYLRLRGMKCLERITFDRNVKVKYLEFAGCKNLKTTKFGFEKLEEFSIRDCPELMELPGFICASGLLRIIIDGCGILENLELVSCQSLRSVSGNIDLRNLKISCCPKLKELPTFARLSRCERIQIWYHENLQNYSLPTTLVSLILIGCSGLVSVIGIGEPIKLTELRVEKCPDLEELPSLSRVSCLKQIVIDSCEKLRYISGFAGLHVTDYMRLCHCSNALIWSRIQEMKSLPSRRMDMIGKAVDGAESILKKDLFTKAGIGAHTVIETYPYFKGDFGKGSKTSFVMACFVVELHSSAMVEDINKSLAPYDINVREGKWIISMVTCNHYTYYRVLEKLEDVLLDYGIVKKGFRVHVKKGQEWKSVAVLRRIVSELHECPFGSWNIL